MTDGSGSVELWCPSCLATVRDLDVCPACAMPGQQRPEAARLRIVVARTHEVSTARLALDQELKDLVGERDRLVDALRGTTPIGFAIGRGAKTDQPPPPTGWRPERVRDVLLWLGAILLTIAAITFAAVAWTHLGPAGRAGILLGVTTAAATLTAFVRNRLRPTAEALAALTIALAIVDWGVARRTALRGDLSTAAWWAIGLALIALVCATIADRTDLTAVRLGAVTLFPAAGIAALVAAAPSSAEVAIGIAVITSLTLVARSLLATCWHPVLPWMTVLGVLGGFAVAVAAITAAADQWGDPGRAGAALAVLSVAVAPLTRLAARRGDEAVDVSLPAGLVTLAIIGSLATLASGTIANAWILAGLAGAGLVSGLVARALPEPYRPGVAGAGLVAMVPAIVSVAGDIATAWLRPLRWLAQPWTGSLRAPVHAHVAGFPPVTSEHLGPTLFVLGSVAALFAAGLLGRSLSTRVLGSGAAGGVALAVVITGVDPSIGLALGVDLTVGTLLVLTGIAVDRRDPTTALAIVATAAVVALPAVGWAVVTPAASLTALAAVLALGTFSAVVFSSMALRVAAAVGAAGAGIGSVAVVLGARDASAGTVGLGIVGVAAALLVATRLAGWTERAQPLGVALEGIGCVGAATGIALAGDRPLYRLLGFAVMTPVLLLAARRPDGRSVGYAWAAVIVGVSGGLTGLAVARIASEWITVPAAVISATIVLLPRFPIRDSWPRFGPALALGFITSVGLALDDGGWRVAIVVVAGFAVVAIGAGTQQGAPILVGGISLVAIGIDGLAPYAASLPRWLLIGTAGALALWAGATADRRLDQLRRLRDTVDRLQ